MEVYPVIILYPVSAYVDSFLNVLPLYSQTICIYTVGMRAKMVILWNYFFYCRQGDRGIV